MKFLILASVLFTAAVRAQQSPPTPILQAELPAGTLVTGCTVPGTVAVTFDDGPYQWTSQLM